MPSLLAPPLEFIQQTDEGFDYYIHVFQNHIDCHPVNCNQITTSFLTQAQSTEDELP